MLRAGGSTMAARETQQSSFGGCSYLKESPAHGKLSPSTQVLNLVIPFEEALKLDIAVDEAVRRLNADQRRAGRRKPAALNLTVHFHTARITVSETRADRA
jgi:hypothetical protein